MVSGLFCFIGGVVFGAVALYFVKRNNEKHFKAAEAAVNTELYNAKAKLAKAKAEILELKVKAEQAKAVFTDE